MPGHILPQAAVAAAPDNNESERQLIIARGGSLTRKTHMDDDEDIFND